MKKTLLLVVIVLIGSLGVLPQSALVNKARVETLDNVVFEIEPTMSSYAFGRDIGIRYQITNLGPKTIYLISEAPQRFENDGINVFIQSPLPAMGGHNYGDYRLIPIPSGKNLLGEYSIAKTTYKNDGVLPIIVGFSYLNEDSIKDESWKLGKSIESKPLLGSLARVVGVGIISVEIKPRQ